VAVEQAAKQLYRLIDVLKVQEVTGEPTVEHEIALVKVRADDRSRGEILTIADMYKAKVVDMAAEALVIETTGTEAEVDALIALLRVWHQDVRSGTVAASRVRMIEEAVKR
jgi:acetolactate synthase-1/3 small subunit